MAWSNSKMFRQYLADVVANTTAVDLDTDTIKAALYSTTPTPDQNVTAALSAYNGAASQWVVANELIDSGGTNWVAGGRQLLSPVVSVATAATVFFDAADTTGAGNVTITATFGCLVYDDTIAAPVAKQGVCYNYFGGTQSVSAGTFTIVWNANGVWRATL